MERLTEYIRTSPSAHHQELARHALVSNCLWNGRWDRAEREIHERVANSEGLALYNALAELASLRRSQRRYEEALAAYRRIEREWPADRVRLFYALSNAVSVCGISLGRYDEAEERARRIFAEWPASGVQLASVHYIYGWTLFLQERFEEAEREWKHILREWPTVVPSNRIHTLVGLSYLCIVRGVDDEAIRVLEEAYETYKDRGPVLVPLRALAIVHALAGRREKVLEALERSAQVYPDFAARAALHPDDPKAAATWKLWSAQFRADGQLVQGLLAYARGDDASAAKLLADSSEDRHTYLASLFDWPVNRLIERLHLPRHE